MRTNRRQFVSTALAGGLAAAFPRSSRGSDAPEARARPLNPAYARLDAILKQPVFKEELFAAPVIIASLELLRFKNSFLCRVRSKEGAEGISVGHGGQLQSLYPVFNQLL